MSTNTDLFGHIPPKMPRLLQVNGCAADRQTESERIKFMQNLTRNTELRAVREPILRARQECRDIQDAINTLRKCRAKIKGQSKAAKLERSAFDKQIKTWRKKLAEKKKSALLN